MKLAVICLAHLGNSSGVELLSRYFSYMDAHLFIHVDSKVSAKPYAVGSYAPNVTFLQERYEIFWGGFNTVRAAVSAIVFAKTIASFDRFMFITENSAPLCSPAELDRRLTSRTDWIAIHAPNPPWVWQRYDDFFFFDSRATSFRYLEIGERAITESDMRCLDRMGTLRREGKVKLPEIYHGCGWWTLCQETVNLILDSYHSDTGLRESFEFSAIPEEQYFHTIIGRSGFCPPRKHFIYVDWDRHPDIKPYIFSRYGELKGLVEEHSELLFVRKVNMESAEVAAFVEELTE